ncbi:MAG: hypothetical protein UH081_00615 [Clostridia bacterium]|nr:hypothetical protein [Clostridia bacterium]
MKSFDYLRETPFFWSRLGFCYDPPRYDENHNQIIFSKNYSKYRRFHKDFENAGVKYHTTILHSGWVDDNTYDYRLTDETLDAVLGSNPDILYMPRVKLNAPVGWCKNHPDDIFVYEGFEDTPQRLSELCGSDKHDWFGFNSNGYSVNGGDGSFKDDRKNIDGIIGLQSFSSPQWLSDACKALEKLIMHINNLKYANQIIGYHVAYGMCGETALWGGWRPRSEKKRGDFGVTNRKMFINFGLEKYGDEKTLLSKWGFGSIDEITVPSLTVRDTKKNSLRELFYDSNKNLICLDYNEFVSSSNAYACEMLCKTVKDATNGNAAAGIFYGYMYMPQAAYSGHLDIEKVITSPYIDFLASPKAYFRTLAGDPGGEQCPSYSINKKAVWLDEIDNWTHLDTRPERAKNFFETRTLILREGVKNLACNQGFWWMDLGEGWYDMPEIMELISDLSEVQKQINKKEHKSISEILLVVDESSLKAMSASYGLTGGLMYNLQSELKLCGAPVDTLRMCDLYDCDLSQYKMIVFANAFNVDEKLRELLKNNAHGKTYVWHYAAGILNPEFSYDNVKEITGFSVKEFEHTFKNEEFGYKIKQYNFFPVPELELDFPLIEITDCSEDDIVSRYPNGKILCAQMKKDNGKSILCTFPSLTASDFRALAVDAGCTMLAPINCTVYADNRIIGIFPKYDIDYMLTVKDLKINNKDEINVKLKANGGEYFIFD